MPGGLRACYIGSHVRWDMGSMGMLYRESCQVGYGGLMGMLYRESCQVGYGSMGMLYRESCQVGYGGSMGVLYIIDNIDYQKVVIAFQTELF